MCNILFPSFVSLNKLFVLLLFKLRFFFSSLLLTSLRQVKESLARPRRWLSVWCEGAADPAQTGVLSVFICISFHYTKPSAGKRVEETQAQCLLQQL